MSDQIQKDLEEAINAQTETDESDESQDDSDLASDTESDNSDSAETEEDSATDSEQSDDEADVDFDFRNTSTSIQNLVSRLRDMPEEERTAQISKLTREKEIEAVKKAFPNVNVEDKAAPVSREEYKQLLQQMEELKSVQKPEELAHALEIARKLQTTETLTDTRLKSLMLQEQFGENAKEVANDTKFMVAFEKYPQLPLEDRLSYACSLSPVAKKLATELEVDKQVRQANTKTVPKGSQTTTTKTMDSSNVDSLESFEKAMEQKFNA